MANLVELGIQYFNDPVRGRPIYRGYIYVGEPDTDPEDIPNNLKDISVITADGTTLAVSQPLRTNTGGNPTYNGEPVGIVTDGAYSLLVQDSAQRDKFYVRNNTQINNSLTLGDISTNGIYAWQSTLEYQMGSYSIGSDRIVYESISSSNTGNDPANDGGSNWVVWQPQDKVQNVAALRLTEPRTDGETVTVIEHTYGGIGGGRFQYDASDNSTPDDNGVTFVTSGGARWKRQDAPTHITPSMFGAYTDETNGSATTTALNNWFDYCNVNGGGCVDIDAFYLFDSTIDKTVLGTSSIDYDMNTATFVPSADFKPFELTLSGTAARNPRKVFRGWRVNVKNISTLETAVWTLNNCTAFSFFGSSMYNDEVSTGAANGHAVCWMFDCVNAADSNWSENMHFYDTYAHTPRRVFNFRRTAGGVAPKNSFARTIIKDLFVATGETGGQKPDYLIAVASDVAVYDSKIDGVYGNNKGDATCFFWNGDGQNTTCSGVRIESGGGFLCDLGSGGTRKPRFLDIEDNFGFGDGLFKGSYDNIDGIVGVGMYPFAKTPSVFLDDFKYLKSGTATSAAASVLTDSTASFPVTGDGLVGSTVTNVSDGSSGTITANTATTVDAVLSGGGSNTWSVSDIYLIDKFVVDTPSISGTNGRAHFGVIEDCVKDQWYEFPYARARGAYLINIAGTPNDTPAYVYAMADDSVSGGSSSFSALTSAVPASGETIEVRWPPGSSAPEFRWTSGARTDPLSISFSYIGTDDGFRG